MDDMRHESPECLQRLQQDVARRQYVPKGPAPIAEAISGLLARKGYAQLEAAAQRDEAWRQVAGSHLAAHCRVGNVRRGVLEVIVRNSTVMQELTYQKKTLLRDIAAALPDLMIRDIRLRVGAVD
ncbi:MAG: DUF721 domain-containing protein [Planctomycetes bacterium]|nr:DUF721 domain-containing protein [Planctomycetota bacterium]